MRRLRFLWATAALLTACAAKAPTTRAAVLDTLVVPGTTVEERESLKIELLSSEFELSQVNPETFETAGDLNQRPISLWFVRGPSGMSSAYILGHADGACCPLVSKAVHELADHPELGESWHSFGFGRLKATARSGGQQALQGLHDQVARFAGQSECAGQIRITVLDGDQIEAAGQDIASLARKAHVAATGAKRPVFVWHDFEEAHPALVAPEVRRGRKYEPLVIEMSEDDFDFPAILKQTVSLAGLGQYIASIRAQLQHVKDIQQVLPLVDKLGDGILGWRGSKVTGDCDAAAIRQADLQLSDLHGRQTLAREMIALFTRNSPAEKAGMAPVLLELQQSLQRLDGFIAANLSAGSTCEWFDIRPFGKESGVFVSFQLLRAQYHGLDLDAAMAEIGELLREAEAMRERPPSDPLPALIDAALRGWPATFSVPEAEQAFDSWLTAHQEALWTKISDQLDRQGTKLRSGDEASPMGFLARSNVVFHIEHTGKRVKIRPYFVLAGSFFTVADPGAGVIRFEAAVADQNLMAMPRQ